MPVFVVVVQSVTDHEPIGNVEADIIGFQLHFLAFLLAQEHPHPQRGNAALVAWGPLPSVVPEQGFPSMSRELHGFG